MNSTRTPLPRRLAASLACLAALPALAPASESGVDNIGPGTDGFFILPLDVNGLPDHMFAFNSSGP
ncbi:lipoprotein [Pseudomonas chlororaphis]|uniref:Lipoprotein n=1 Tax=Pseudomonas chlororaphis TaxID=587753 RepID=A0A3G7TQ61_9PSED|nr:lipoprotein [Pseudomonas chlororaphis]